MALRQNLLGPLVQYRVKIMSVFTYVRRRQRDYNHLQPEIPLVLQRGAHQEVCITNLKPWAKPRS